jgi:hypothetical protein
LSTYYNSTTVNIGYPILSAYQIYHNYFRTHSGLIGMSPAGRCGIKIEGENKWKNNNSKCVEKIQYIK